MKQEDKNLLLKELCTRQACGVKVQYNGKIYTIDYVSSEYKEVKLDIPDNYTVGISEVKPYLRSMSNMTDEEYKKYTELRQDISDKLKDWKCANLIDWLNANYFDHRGLIPMGLALEAPDGMYNLKQL